MQALSVRKMGGFGALFVVFFTVLFTLFALLAATAEQADGEVPWMAVAADYALVLVALFGLAVVPAVSELVAPASPGWVRWTGSLAQLGFAVLAVVSFWQAEYEMTLSNASLSLPAFSIEEGALPAPDLPAAYGTSAWEGLVGRFPKGWLEVAAVGLWMLSVSRLGSGLFPVDLISVGRVAGLLSFCIPLGLMLQVDPLLTLGVAGGLVATPLWFGWVGVVLLRSERTGALSGSPDKRAPRRANRFSPFWSLRRDRHPAVSRPEVPVPPVDPTLH